MEYEVVLWRIGYAGSSEGPYRLEEVFERLKERRWTGEVMVHGRGRTDNWTPIEDVPEFAPLLAQLRGTYLGSGGEMQWRASTDAQERGIQHEVWTEPQSQLSTLSQPGIAWNKAGIEVSEDSFGFLAAPPTPPAPPEAIAAFAPAPTPISQDTAPLRPAFVEPTPISRGIVPKGTTLPGFSSGSFQVPVPTPLATPYTQTIPGPTATSPVTRIITGPPSREIRVQEDGLDAFLAVPVAQVAAVQGHTIPSPIPAAMPLAMTNAAREAVVDKPMPQGPRVISGPPSLPGIVVTEDDFDAFLR